MNVEVIAEIGSNHNGSLERAFELIRQADMAGVDTVKFQLFTADELWDKEDPRHATTQTVALPKEWLPELKEYTESFGMEFLCTPFSPRGVDVLENLGVKRYKISSGDLTYKALLSAVRETERPVLLSVGFSTKAERIWAIQRLRYDDAESPITLLHCTGGYPTEITDANLGNIITLSDEFPDLPIGLSSHWKEWWLDISMIHLISVVEKHFDLDDGNGVEAAHSLTTTEMGFFTSAVLDAVSAFDSTPGFSEPDLYARKNYRRNPVDNLRPRHR